MLVRRLWRWRSNSTVKNGIEIYTNYIFHYKIAVAFAGH